MQRKLNRRVLVIEDDNDIRRLITDALRNAGLDVVAAVDAGQALRTALARKPAAVVLDIGLPDFDGTQFVARWRERRPDASDVPIVVVSGRADRRDWATPASGMRAISNAMSATLNASFAAITATVRPVGRAGLTLPLPRCRRAGRRASAARTPATENAPPTRARLERAGRAAHGPRERAPARR